MPNQNSKFYRWFDQRYNISSLYEFLSTKSVPRTRHTIWYYFGGASLFLFIIQVVTGILLLVYYRVGEGTSYESVKFIMSKVRFGWLIRSLHSWSANLMILAVFIHMFSVFFTKAYRKPRELTWASGFILLALALTFGFSGYLLPWNELSYFATKVGSDIIGSIPLIGKELMLISRGGEDVTGATLSRFFGLHVAILPGIFTVILTLHLIFIQIQGMSEPKKKEAMPPEKRKYIPFFPNFVLRELLLWLILLNVLAILALFFQMELGIKADPFSSAPAGIKPEWYFMFMFESFKFLPATIFGISGELFGILIFGLAGVLWFLVPFWDVETKSGHRNRLLNLIGLFVVMFIIVMTILGYYLS